MTDRFDLKGQFTFDAGDPEIHWIFSQMIFTTGPIARILRDGGYEIQRRVEEEQAAVFFWMVRCYQTFGADWRTKADAMLKAMDPERLPTPADANEKSG